MTDRSTDMGSTSARLAPMRARSRTMPSEASPGSKFIGRHWLRARRMLLAFRRRNLASSESDPGEGGEGGGGGRRGEDELIAKLFATGVHVREYTNCGILYGMASTDLLYN